MAKKRSSDMPESREDWEAHDAMHTLMRAGEIVKNKGLLKRARKKAAEHASKMQEVADRAGRLAKMGHISEKAAAKHLSKGKKNANQGGKVAALEKTAPIASGSEGDSSQTVRGITTH